MKNIFFAVLLTTLGILHMPAFAKEGCRIVANYNTADNWGTNPPTLAYIISIVGFETGKAEFPTECLQEFKDTVNTKLSDDIIGATIVGYASQLGDADYNATLSAKRADTVWYIMENMELEFPLYRKTSGESWNNVSTVQDNDNHRDFRSAEVFFHYPQMTANYETIIFLKKWKEDTDPDNQKCKANELFTKYISHLRDGKSDVDFDSDEIEKTLKECKGASNDATDTQALTILELYTKLSKYHDKFRSKVSVWKNADGSFNTARLASDSIAGVVLGTAGGLITSNIVKKNQIENGFEDIKCTIGGQNVAAWGDQFRIGIH